MNKMVKVFVYGSLKRGLYNHQLMEGSEFIGEAHAEGVVLTAPPGNLYPFAGRGEGRTVGEVYEVDQRTLRQLDRLEGHPHYYRREKLAVTLAEGWDEEAWVYLYDGALAYPPIPTGEWSREMAWA